jgi:hypothetical protein
VVNGECEPPIGSKGFTEKSCAFKAHVTCGNWDTSQHDLCGYLSEGSPDHYGAARQRLSWLPRASACLCLPRLRATGLL